MAKEIRLNAFEMNCVAHQSPGLWRHPRDRSREYKRLRYWIELAQTLERGLFDGLFLADVLGVYDVFGGDARAALTHAAQVPVNDPLLLVPAMAAATRHLGFGVTVNLSFEPPYNFARRMSTLDHLTDGRIGWNIVTGYLDSAARGAGRDKQVAHDDRYAIAEDFMAVVYKLWEGSWADDAVRADAAAGVFADPDRVRKAVHDGDHFRLDALHLSEPSPQRTPVLYQAGSSPAGRLFAARHAEGVFLSGPSKSVIAPRVAAIRANAAKLGRDPKSVLMFALATAIVGASDAEAQAKLADYRRYADLEGALTLLSGWTGSISQNSISTRLSSMWRATRAAARSKTSRAPTPTEAGPCGRPPSTSPSAESGLSSSARQRRSLTGWKSGSTRPTSTASISPSR